MTIFEKIPASGFNCLVLEPRESFVARFDLGDWSKIRVGAFFSYTDTSLNGYFADEDMGVPVVEQNRFSLGLKDSLPSLPGVATSGVFMGMRSQAGFETNLDSSSFSNVSRLEMQFITGGIVSDSGSLPTDLLDIPNAADAVGTSAYCMHVGFQVFKSGVFYSGVPTDNATKYTDTTVTNLRKVMTDEVNYRHQSYVTGNAVSGVPLDSFFAYSPFFYNRLRIHTYLIEKYE